MVEWGRKSRMYVWIDLGICFLLILLILLVPTAFSAWTEECGYVKNVILAGLVLLGTTVWTVRGILAQRAELTGSPVHWAVLFYWGAAGGAVLLSHDSLVSARAFWRLTVFVLLYFLVSNVATTRRRVVILLASTCFAAILVAAYAFAQRLGHDPVAWSQSSQDRVFSSIGNPNMFAGYLVIVIPLALAVVCAARSWGLRGLGGIAGLSCVIALTFTQTKGAWLACLVALATMAGLVLYARLFKKAAFTPTRKLVLGVLIALTLVGAGYLARPAVKRFRNTFHDSARVRLIYWRGAWEMFRENPFTGVGLGTFQIQFPKYRPVDFRAAGVTYNTMHAHSEYMETLAEQGIVGAAALAVLVVTTFFAGLRALRRTDARSDRWILCGLLAAAAGTLSHSVVSVVLRWSVCPTFLWIVIGVLVAMSRVASNRKPVACRWPLHRYGQVLAVMVVTFVVAGAAKDGKIADSPRARASGPADEEGLAPGGQSRTWATVYGRGLLFSRVIFSGVMSGRPCTLATRSLPYEIALSIGIRASDFSRLCYPSYRAADYYPGRTDSC